VAGKCIDEDDPQKLILKSYTDPVEDTKDIYNSNDE